MDDGLRGDSAPELLEAWLGEHEQEFSDLTLLQEECRWALEEREHGSAGT
jgi:hypothetical protein